jgi:hypothetical protein
MSMIGGWRLIVYWVVIHGVQFVLGMLSVTRLVDKEKDIEILLLRQQLRIATRSQDRGPNIPRWEKCSDPHLLDTKLDIVSEH